MASSAAQGGVSRSIKKAKFSHRLAPRSPRAGIFLCPSTRAYASPTAADELKMPVPEASAVIVKVTHPCYVSALKAKLHRSLEIPLEDIRYPSMRFR